MTTSINSSRKPAFFKGLLLVLFFTIIGIGFSGCPRQTQIPTPTTQVTQAPGEISLSGTPVTPSTAPTTPKPPASPQPVSTPVGDSPAITDALPSGTLPAPTPTSPDTSTISETGLIATVPDYLTIDMSQVRELVSTMYPGKVPRKIQLLLLLTKNDEAYLVLGLDTNINRWITAATVTGKQAPSLKNIPKELDLAGKIIVADSINPLEPVKATPDQVNANPANYTFKRVVMNTTYLLSSARLKNSPIIKKLGFALATDKFGSANPGDYLTLIDPYNTETQIRAANIYGTVLYPTTGLKRLLDEVFKFAPEHMRDMLDRPSVFFEGLDDDEAQLLNIGELVPTPKEPSLKLSKYHGEMVAIKGVAVGGMVRTEDIPQLKNGPIQFTSKAVGIADLTGAMPIIGISSEDVSGEVFGHFQFELSIYRFEEDKTFAFLISKKAMPLDPIESVERAKFGERVKSSLRNYVVTEMPRLQVTSDLILEQVDLLLPQDSQTPMIITRHPNLITGDYLKTVAFDGYLIDAHFLGVQEDMIRRYGSGIIVVNQTNISVEKGTPPIATPVPLQTPGPTLAPAPTPIPPATPVPTPAPTPPSTSTPTPVFYTINVSINPYGAGIVSLSPPGGTYQSGAVVTLTAAPAPGYAFDHWEGSISGTSANSAITMNSNKNIVAYFRRIFP